MDHWVKKWVRIFRWRIQLGIGSCKHQEKSEWKSRWPWPPLAGKSWPSKAGVKYLSINNFHQRHENRHNVVKMPGFCTYDVRYCLERRQKYPQIPRYNTRNSFQVVSILMSWWQKQIADRREQRDFTGFFWEVYK